MFRLCCICLVFHLFHRNVQVRYVCQTNDYQPCQCEATTSEDWNGPLLCTTDINNVIIIHRNVQVRCVRRTVIRHVNVRLQPPETGKIHYFVLCVVQIIMMGILASMYNKICISTMGVAMAMLVW